MNERSGAANEDWEYRFAVLVFLVGAVLLCGIIGWRLLAVQHEVHQIHQLLTTTTTVKP